MKQKEISSLLSSFIGKLLRDRFGKGPESIHITYDSRCITMHMRHFVGPVEQLLLSQNKEEAFRDTRRLVMESLLPDLQSFIAETVGLDVEDFYYDWDIRDHSGILIGLFDNFVNLFDDPYPGKEAIHARVSDVTRICEKLPESVRTFWPSPRVLVIIREGLLIDIEKELLELGYESTLRIAKRTLEKQRFANDIYIEATLEKSVAGMYLDWKFEKDKSVLVYTFKD